MFAANSFTGKLLNSVTNNNNPNNTVRGTIKIVDNSSIANTLRSVKEMSSSSNASGASLKGKLHVLQESIGGVADELKEHKKNFYGLIEQKENIRNIILMKSDHVQKNIKGEIEKVEKEMDRNFSHQKAENSRLQQQISQLKSEKTTVQNQLLALQRRIADLELQVGEYEHK